MPQTIALLTNPTAGKGKGVAASQVAQSMLRAAGYEVQTLQGGSADEALDLARGVVAEGVETLVVCGGDGMVHLGVQAVAETSTRLGVIPAGTGNDVARYLDLPREDPAAAAAIVIGSRTRRIDLARTGATYYVTVMAAGFDAIVNERANAMTWPRGQMRYNLATLLELPRRSAISYILDVDGTQERVDATMVAVGNGPSFGGGLRIAEGARLDDGLLDVIIVEHLKTPELLALYPKLFKGTHITHPKFRRVLARDVTVAAQGIVAYADGERIAPLPLTVSCVPGALEVLVP